MQNFSFPDQRADFWKVRIVRQCANSPKVYLFPSLLEWLNERPQLVLNAALMKREKQLDIEVPREPEASERRSSSSQANGDPLTLFIGGYTKSRPSTKDIVNYLQRSYAELYQRHGQGRSRELVSLIDASLLLNEASFAKKISEENKYEHDLLQLHRCQAGNDKWDNYKTSVMLRLSSSGVPSAELVEAATVTRLMCDIMAGPTQRRRSAVAEMAASGLKLDAMVLAKLYFSDEEIFEQLSRECSHLFQNGINAEVSEIVELTNGAISPFFQRRMLRCIDQLSCYRILRIDFALNEHAILKKKLIGRLELAQNVRYVIADALAYRNFAAVNLIAENAAAHLDKYSFFSGLEQIVYPMAMKLLSEATRMIFHAKPASMGWKKQSDESDRLGSKLQQHPNGYIGGLIEMWLERVALVEVADSKDVYRQRSLHSSIESIRAVLREDTTFNPICRGLLVFACDLVCSILEAIFGRPCQRIDELIENPYIDHHTGMSLVRKLTKGMLSSHADERVLNILGQLCAISIMDTPDASSHSTADYRVPSCSRRGVLLAESAGIEGVTDYEFAQIASPLAEPNRSHTAKDVPVSKGANGSAKTSGDKQCLEEDYFRDLSHQQPRKEPEQQESGHSPSEPEVSAPDSEVLVSSERSSDQNDVLSVAPSRSVCEQVETMMAGVKYCREREHGGAGIDGKQPIKQCEAEVGPKEEDVTATDVLDEPSVDSLEHEELEAEAVDSSELNELHTDEVPPVFQQHLQDQCSQQKSKIEDTDDMKQESGQVPEAPVEAVDDTECAKIISDDHLDFSSQNPSVRTKWLSSDDFASGDNSGDATSVLLESTVSKKDDFESGPCKVTFDGRNDEQLLWEPARGVPAPSHEETGMSGSSWNPGGAVSPGLDAEETIREKSSVGEPKGYCVVDQTTDPSALASQEQDFGSSVEEEQGISDVGAKNTAMESTKHLGGSRVQNDSPRVMSPGKAMLHKILSECAGPAVPSSKPTSKPEKCATDPGARESCFSGVSREQSNPFPSTRGMVLSTSLESDPEFSNTSTDDDIAGCHSLGPKVAEAKAKIISDEGGQTKGKATLETEKDSAVLDSSGAVHAAPLDTDVWEDVAETPSSQGDSLKCESYASTKDRVGSVPEHVPKAKDSTVSAGSGFESEINSPNRDTSERGTPSRDSCQKARSDFEERGDVRHRPSRLEPIHEQEAMEGSDVEDARATAQKKFLSGGFDSSTSSGFGGFGGGYGKENTPGGDQSFGERRGGFEAERGSGFGGGRGGTRGNGRVGGRGFDKDAPRDGQRDRDSRDGFRGRGGYGGGNMRDSRSSEGRGGYRGSRP